MNQPTTSSPARLHPVMIGAATSVIIVSLLGAAAITGVIPVSHGSMAPTARMDQFATPLTVAPSNVMAMPVTVSPTRYITADGQLLDIVPRASQVTQSAKAKVVHQKVAQHKVIHHYNKRYPAYAQNTYSEPAWQQGQPYYAPQQQHPAQRYVSDMHPVGTGVGAAVGGLLGNQVGGGNGKKLATIAGVLVGGYAGNEIAHNRNPLQ